MDDFDVTPDYGNAKELLNGATLDIEGGDRVAADQVSSDGVLISERPDFAEVSSFYLGAIAKVLLARELRSTESGDSVQ